MGFDQFVCIEGEDEHENGTEANQIRAVPEGIPVAGQAFYNTNGQPIPFWDFAKALWHEYNGFCDQPTAVPVFLGQWVAGLGESINWMLGRPEPTMTTKRIANAVTPRYFNIEKARRLLEYEPQISLDEGIKRSVTWYKDAVKHHPEQIQPKK